MSVSTFDEQSGWLTFLGELTIYQAADVKSALVNAFDAGQLAGIDLAGVTEIDSAGLQLLLLAKRTADTRGDPFEFRKPSDAVKSAFDLVNMVAFLSADNPESEA